ncbi:GH1 family beta-glucosidase [Colwellia sp. 1_MG-2023]|uniref:GH1 family beta-glucosidase n=1 Tax=unclassified Colwellia TaxID=196834 RepID=UPI001C080EAC|nr:MULTISPECIES: GH1 family beta-glucosidase [unclassified Colwellia]MBU2924116.1 beta-glucosidase [Colwellia sp. C2M11]MDO6652007.1 GH1 family beta-glucosidase [Colwellia sp. 3_MG-2023]MDO6664783.1 GH1 family beta-glucosidase [Colwellia sp. 2_MG-2023]MDO6689175.1 GH1 family beta-glucosidase [Colwellia sp. 1_MG-2023]
MTAKLSLPLNSAMLTKDFIYGVATASFQIEGGADDRLPCIWDTFCNTPNKVIDGSNGLIACDHFNLWQQDIALIESLGVDAYRLSISWPRVMTKSGELNPDGVNYYLAILDALKAKNIKAFVTLYHWDLPQHLEDEGGWLNRETAYKFRDYVNLISQAFGDRVYSYATLNEPFCSSFLGYEVGIHAPGKVGKEFGRKAAHHLLLAHGLAMAVLTKNSPKSKNGIVLNFTPCYPESDSQADKVATEFADDYFNQWYIKPIYDGEYPSILAQLPTEHQPDIKDGDMAIISHPTDFLGVNFYTRAIYRADDKEHFFQIEPPEPRTDIGWEIYPKALNELLVSLNEKYTLPPIYITENGAAIDDKIVEGVVNDTDRIEYYQLHLNAINDAIEHGVDIKGYFAWSLMDNFEWAEGYLKRFGIVYVDYDSQVRTIKNSGLAYKALITCR